MSNISVVIPTLGDQTIKKTVERLNQGSKVPGEIIICIPKNNVNKLNRINYENVFINVCDIKGQVAQRASGFKIAKYDMVMQLDDDVLIEKDTLAILSEQLLKLGRGNAIGPVYYDLDSDKCLHRYKLGLIGFINNVYAKFVCSALWGKNRMGTITKIGISYGIDDAIVDDALIQTDWLPGGCVLMYKSDLITDNYYPYVGKAYAEDVLHSILRCKKNIAHYVYTNVICKTSNNPIVLDFNSILCDIKARRYILTFLPGKIVHLELWYLVDILKRIILFFCNRLILINTK